MVFVACTRPSRTETGFTFSTTRSLLISFQHQDRLAGGDVAIETGRTKSGTKGNSRGVDEYSSELTNGSLDPANAVDMKISEYSEMPEYYRRIPTDFSGILPDTEDIGSFKLSTADISGMGIPKCSVNQTVREAQPTSQVHSDIFGAFQYLVPNMNHVGNSALHNLTLCETGEDEELQSVAPRGLNCWHLPLAQENLREMSSIILEFLFRKKDFVDGTLPTTDEGQLWHQNKYHVKGSGKNKLRRRALCCGGNQQTNNNMRNIFNRNENSFLVQHSLFSGCLNDPRIDQSFKNQKKSEVRIWFFEDVVSGHVVAPILAAPKSYAAPSDVSSQSNSTCCESRSDINNSLFLAQSDEVSTSPMSCTVDSISPKQTENLVSDSPGRLNQMRLRSLKRGQPKISILNLGRIGPNEIYVFSHNYNLLTSMIGRLFPWGQFPPLLRGLQPASDKSLYRGKRQRCSFLYLTPEPLLAAETSDEALFLRSRQRSKCRCLIGPLTLAPSFLSRFQWFHTPAIKSSIDHSCVDDRDIDDN